ncbi:MAG: sugar ABC transporter permease [Caldilineaceae bacterium]|nr:sugar ABC transporter permease [Caldilineaceae bacterium]
MSVVLIPGLLTAYISFTDWNGVSPQINWIGLGNFRAIFADNVFWKALGNNIRWTILFVTVPVFIGMLSAVLLLGRRINATLYQLIYLFPYVLAPITNALLWLNIIFNPLTGVIGFLRKIGLNVPAPLGNINTALYAVAAVDIWHYWGFLTVVYLASLRQTPMDQVEAAQAEGANGWQVFRYVYFPSILPTVLLMYVMIIIFSFLTFDYVYLLTGGGPAHATEMLSTYAYTLGFSTFQVGRASAVGLVMSMFGLIAAAFYTWLSRREITE